MTEKQLAADEDALAKRRVPCLIAYLHPFRIIESDTLSEWSASIEQVNTRSWDYIPLHEVAGGIDVGLASPYHMVPARDGALAVPPIEGLRSHQDATDFFNRCLAALLIGGVYCEAITTEGLDFGSIIDWKYIRSSRSGSAAPNRFHGHVRHRQASPMEAIALHEPQTVSISTLTDAMKIGLETLGKAPALRGEYLLKGVTGISHRDWGAALANLWIVVEQLVSELWTREVVNPTLLVDQSKARRNQLNDSRTWTASAKIELLFQKELLELETFNALSVARKARNDLAHEGKPPTEHDAESAYMAVCGLISIVLGGEHLPLLDLNLPDYSFDDPFAQREPRKIEPKFWMAIPKLPGEEDLEKAETTLREKHRKTEPGA